ncbi:bifunctional oligoribonuclease/PAP phosphatase NrnA [Mycoplasma sp. M5725]|uniref:Bifunctional oligoribonuclease/PAP phosphatase NrnA n=1 Tax=Mycoplasma phocimorsus TaxID=3045839 RepID=A0AAJ1PSE4_9MOLU|nr:bifunctional oligoribonuclease/PAP phosphatase NrnA [Mycoplasma phocimorsus]MDJ1645961.1 bifunctional oligoribonuclease/PAP phosphatase NrnA [Mycoplasma phocimorsus]MDJ1648483.1 bifunctional oligoribonuclease/PAP phosphatase NrnA [Mycoplasma phocimorsus]MDJ1648620.1 bifunctional oligoribonuclease/PAP phosphatase NrnA [Mycoplasma phocimorsus]
MIIGSYKIAFNAIKKHKNIIIFHHTRPDGDCLGSQFGLAQLIRANFPNKNVYIIGDNNNSFEWMNYKFDKWEDVQFENSLGIIVDASNANRIFKSELLLDERITHKLRIDHHPVIADINYDYEWVDSSYVAAAEQIAYIAWKKKMKVPYDAAKHIYLGITTDSGRFLYASTSPRTYETVSNLIKKSNFDIQFVYNNLYAKTMKDIQITGEIMSNFKKQGRVLYYIFSKELQDKMKITPDQAAVYNNSLANIEDNRIWLFFIELEDGSYRTRLRSNGPRVNKVAEAFNAGGHDQAAGAMVKKEEIQKVIDLANQEIINFESENK